LHQSEGRSTRSEELLPLTQATCTRAYFHAKRYILVPDLRLTTETFPTPRADGAIGKVTDSEWEGIRHQQWARYHPPDRASIFATATSMANRRRIKPQQRH